MQAQRNGRVLQFGAFELKTDTGEIRKHGTKIRLQGKPLQLLQALLDRPGDVVTREELRDRLWAVDTYVDFESGLNTAVNRLRLALGDSADNPRYVETLARSGYRFMAPVSENHAPVLDTPPPPPPVQLPPEPKPAPARHWPIIASAAALVVFAALLLMARQKPAFQPIFHQVTFRRCTIRSARFAPDGQSVIYEARSLPSDRELYMANTISPESRALGFPGKMLTAVSKSGELALVTIDSTKPSHNLVRVPLNGGEPMPVERGVWNADWAPDGSRMAVVRYLPAAILEYPRGKVLYRGSGWLGDARISPSGHQVAFIDHPARGDDAGNIMVVDESGASHTLSSGWASVDGLAWSPSGREVWFTAARSGVTRALRAVDMAGKERVIAAFPGTLMLFDISPAGRVLLAREQLQAVMTEAADGNQKEKDLSWFDYSNVVDITADGRQILFDETGEGGGAHHAVYVRHLDSPSAVRVGDGVALALSPDGNWVVTRPDRDQTTVNLIPLSPGQPRTLPGGGLKYDFVRFFPGSDRLLVGGSMAGGPPKLYIQALDGSRPVPLNTSVFIMRPEISNDGQQIAGVDTEQRLVVVPASGGEPRVIFSPFPLTVLRWSQGDKTLLAQADGVPAVLCRVDLDTGKYKPLKQLAPFDLSGVSHVWPAAISKDEHTTVYSYLRNLSELFVVDGWQ